MSSITTILEKINIALNCRKKSNPVQKTVSQSIKREITEQLERLSKCGIHLIQCISPNENMRVAEWHEQSILTQLESMGMLTMLKLMQFGYPTKIPLDRIHEKCRVPIDVNSNAFCKELFKTMDLTEKDFAIGNTLAFFRPGKLVEFDEIISTISTNLNDIIIRAKKLTIRSKWSQLIFCALYFTKCKYTFYICIGTICY